MTQTIEEVDKKKAEIELALKDFGLELRRNREAKNLNQRELHEITGIDKTVLSELERGLYTPSLALIKQLADGLGINPHILVAAYYGIQLPEFNLRDKETLENFIRLALEYTGRITPFTSPLPPYNPTIITPAVQARIDEADQLADEQAQAEAEAEGDTGDQGQSQDQPHPTMSNESD